MKVAIRTDASSRIGSGHVMRCKALADELRRRGTDVRFVCCDRPGNLIPLLSDAGYNVAVLPALVDAEQSLDAQETIAGLDGFVPDWLVVDQYGLDEEWESQLRRHVDRIVVIDDLANRRHACDVLLDQNWFGNETQHRYRGLVPEQCHCVLGPRYALLQPLFWQLRESLPPRDGVIRRILVFFGAVDSRNLTVMVLQGLQAPEFADVAIDVVVGHANSDAPKIERLVSARPGATLHRELPSLAGLMVRADVMLGAGGTTTWERCCLGLPSIVAITAENQEWFTTAVAATGAHHSLGQGTTVSESDWVTALREFRSSPEKVRTCTAAAHLMTDGRGVYRVARVLQPAHSSQVAEHNAKDEPLPSEGWETPELRRSASSTEPDNPEVSRTAKSR